MLRRLLAALLLLSATLLSVWWHRRPPAWLRADPLAEPFGWSVLDSFERVRRAEAEDAASASDAGSEPAVVALDTATTQALVRLPGIGPVIAARVLEFRDREGPVHRLEELLAVKGIGERTLERLRPWIAFPGDAATTPDSAPSTGATDPLVPPSGPAAEKDAGRAP